MRLGIDFGTSSTVAVLALGDGRVAPLLFGETPLLPSSVFLGGTGELLTGRDALHLGRSQPEMLEPNPKRRIDEGTVLLGDSEVPVAELIAAVLRRVRAEAVRVGGEPLEQTVLTCPASWGPRRRAVVRDAGARAGLGAVTLLAEPVAAASYFVHVLGNDIPVGRCLVVYDFGAGTFDASVVRRDSAGFAVLAEEGLTDAGGLDVDAAIVSYLGAVYAERALAAWEQLVHPTGQGQRRANRQLWNDVREAKEMLSRSATTTVHLPTVELDAPLGREQLEFLARPVLDRTVAATRAAIQAAGVRPGDVAGLFLVGGSSRIPLAATLLHRALGLAPTAIEQPELVVASGSLHAPAGAALDDTAPFFAAPPPSPAAPPPSPAAPPPLPAAATRVEMAPVVAEPAPPQAPMALPMGAGPPRTARSARRASIVVAAGLAVAAVIALVAWWPFGGDGTGSPDGGTAKAACGTQIAFMGAVTGPGAAATVPVLRGVRLAIKQYAAGHPGCGAELAPPLDTKGTADSALELVGQVKPEVLGVVGPLLSTEVEKASARLNDVGLPFITPTATRDALSLGAPRMFHRTTPTDGKQGAAAARFISGKLSMHTVGVVMENDAYGWAASDALGQAGQVTVVDTEKFTGGQEDFAAAATKIRNANPDAVFFAGLYREAAFLVKELRKQQYKGPVVATDGVDDPSFTQAVADDSGIYMVCGCRKVENQQFITAFKGEYQEPPNSYAAVAYDTANILLDGIAHGVDSRAKMAEHLKNTTFQGVMGKYRFTETGDLDDAVAQIGVYRLNGDRLEYSTAV